MMKLGKKMQHPFALVGQGFLVGAALFFTTQAQSGAEVARSPATSGSILSTLQV